VTVGDPENAADTAGYGAVADVYRISKYEVTNAQYAEFLNAVADTDTYDLYNTDMASGYLSSGGITRSGSSGSYEYSAIAGRGDMPVNYVSFYDALRFANWLHNGQPTGAQDNSTTEDGAYTITAQGIADNSITRNAGATIFLTSEDEWYKAAYYDASTLSYNPYPFADGYNGAVCEVPPGTTSHSANCQYAAGNLTDVGAYTGSPSEYGTFDQGGNLWEWNEAIYNVSQRRLRGSSWNDWGWGARSSASVDYGPATENYQFGFRVAMILSFCGDGTADAGEQCDDGNRLSGDCCDQNCQFEPPDSPCEDGNACTANDTCSAGSCMAGPPLLCSDGIDCTHDSCNPPTGCVFAPDSGLCNDSEVCTDDVCNPATGCVFTPNSGTCSDGDACTEDDVCSSGGCQGGTPLACDDGNICTDDLCDPLTGCVFAPNSNSCDDGDACTFGDACNGGLCSGSGTLSCDDGDPCTVDGCDALLGCTHSPVPGCGACGDGRIDSGEQCDDGDTASGDGCDGSCTTESGYQCVGEPSTCTPESFCGDAATQEGEQCDDGNGAAGDGCDGSCEVETGYECVGSPSSCTPASSITCGDAQIVSPESCDDGNSSAGDGCSDICRVEQGYSCSGEPSSCVLSASLDLVEVDLQTPGDALVTRDLGTGLDWLDLTETVGLSFNNIVNDPTTWANQGWRHARTGEVCAVLAKLGIAPTPCPGSTMTAAYAGAQQFVALFGETMNFPFPASAYGIFDYGSATQAGAALVVPASPDSLVSVDLDAYPKDQAYPDRGQLLVRSSSLCGDGASRLGEECDDGNENSGDGCSTDCEVETGFVCTGSPSNCTFVTPFTCGDGSILSPESCDDGGAALGDGCSDICRVEQGYSCSGEPSVCILSASLDLIEIDLHTPADALVTRDLETGLDWLDLTETVGLSFNNIVNNPTTWANQGWRHARTDEVCAVLAKLQIAPTPCPGSTMAAPYAGAQQFVALFGATPIGNPFPGSAWGDFDSGSATQAGEALVAPASPNSLVSVGLDLISKDQADSFRGQLLVRSSPLCGDGVARFGESCDDNNAVDGDGCSRACFVEPGFLCQGSPSSCAEQAGACGDGAINSREACDDGSTLPGDGCGDTCLVEAGYACSGQPSSCVIQILCGNGIGNFGEGCDDANTASGDGCSAACQVESGFACSGSPSACFTACGDGLDNDGDGASDYPNDAGCAGVSDLTETSPGLICDDGIDNDVDGTKDFPADIGCKDSSWPAENPECSDGVDNGDSDNPPLADWDGAGMGNPDPDCVAPWDKSETPSSRRCGLGAELALLLPPLVWLWLRRRPRRG
jgi:cysteine-rich repeat protein